MIELHVASNISSTWVLDTGCGTNICNSCHGLRSARHIRAEEAPNLGLGDGSRIITRVVGVFDLHLSNGFVISLDPCYLVDNLIRNIVSVSYLFKLGLEINFSVNGCSLLSSDKTIICDAHIDNGIHVLNTDYKTTLSIEQGTKRQRE
ncbi:hypothetical protein CFOL_v3_19755 [Cephalotus follicularis]|uniref:Retrovirus-related Pol polyprotein from transposon TNT 1-94-like beta-barrel domain-containing protein n=1 Tax=Cephalotus follicularis TaxID=3775 RepID=A0A1Q3C7S7_CEPFO|nr:hypothetical protein CFOL_v3_19755 [Cephalotus follicularis]